MAGTYTHGDTASTVFHQPARAGGPTLPRAGGVFPTGPSGYVQAAGDPRTHELSGCSPCQQKRYQQAGLGALGRAMLGNVDENLSPGAYAAASLIGGSASGSLVGFIASSEVEGAITGGLFSGGIAGLSNAAMFMKRGKGASATLMLVSGLGALGWSLWRFQGGLRA